MEFYEFARLLKPICGGGKSNADFVITLFDHYISRPAVRSKNLSRNPLRDKSTRSLQEYFSGDRFITAEEASLVIARQHKDSFKKLVGLLTEPAQRDLADLLKRNGYEDTVVYHLDKQLTCIFKNILMDRASENTKE
jgi:bisphosphoglycerate-dependent phosphoglycerate mutase